LASGPRRPRRRIFRGDDRLELLPQQILIQPKPAKHAGVGCPARPDHRRHDAGFVGDRPGRARPVRNVQPANQQRLDPNIGCRWPVHLHLRRENYLTNWLQRPDILAAIGQDRHQHPPKPTASSTATPVANAEFEVGPASKHPAWLLLPDLADVIGPHAPQNWSAAPLETKRALIKAVCSVTVMPTKPGPHFDPDSVVIRPL